LLLQYRKKLGENYFEQGREAASSPSIRTLTGPIRTPAHRSRLAPYDDLAHAPVGGLSGVLVDVVHRHVSADPDGAR